MIDTVGLYLGCFQIGNERGRMKDCPTNIMACSASLVLAAVISRRILSICAEDAGTQKLGQLLSS